MEDAAKLVSGYLTSMVEAIAAVIILIAIIKFLVSYFKHIMHPKDGFTNTSIRVHFGSALSLALELLLAADVLKTAVAPSWDDIGKLAAIAAIRTALNFFLERDLKQEPDSDTAKSNYLISASKK